MKSFSDIHEKNSRNPIVWLFTFLRALGGFVLVPLFTVFSSVVVILYGANDRDEEITFHMWLWSQIVLRYFGADVVAEGFEKIPQTGGAILAFNHQSHFDIPAITSSTKRLLRYGAKIELFKIPVFGPAIRVAGCLPIARDNRKEVFRIYDDAAKKFQQGIIYALAPEGTRQANPEIASFKKGPFIFAVNAGVPIVPVVIEGADRVLPKGNLLVNLGRMRRTIHVRVLDPIFARNDLNTGEAKPATSVDPNAAVLRAPIVGSTSPVVLDLLERTRQAMVATYAELQKSSGARQS